MKTNLKSIKDQIHKYFGEVKHRVHIFTYHQVEIADIEYEDFRNEKHVEEDLKKILGEGIQVCLKRECSNTMEQHILHAYGPVNPIRLHQLIEEYEE